MPDELSIARPVGSPSAEYVVPAGWGGLVVSWKEYGSPAVGSGRIVCALPAAARPARANASVRRRNEGIDGNFMAAGGLARRPAAGARAGLYGRSPKHIPQRNLPKW